VNAFNAMKFISNFVKSGKIVQRLKWGTQRDRQTDRQDDTLIRLLPSVRR
jgi:hypothetical protein